MMAKEDKIKCYVTRDEGDDFIWLWRKPTKGNFAPQKLKDCDIVCWMREDIDKANYYHIRDFKKKFGFIINKKVRKCSHISKKLLDSEDYKMLSNDSERKK